MIIRTRRYRRQPQCRDVKLRLGAKKSSTSKSLGDPLVVYRTIHIEIRFESSMESPGGNIT